MMPRLFIFDADDTLRTTTVAHQPCPHGPDEWALLPGVRERLVKIPWGPRGPFLALASNQDHVGYGLLPAAVAHRLLLDLALAAAGPTRPAPYIGFCPHPAEDRCACRKPAPGLLLRALAHFQVNAAAALFVGNAPSDAAAAHRAGIAYCHAGDFFTAHPRRGTGQPKRRSRQ
jgi:D-glycero-D-manno-heptose 1,7-bisphosphate phosphatase